MNSVKLDAVDGVDYTQFAYYAGGMSKGKDDLVASAAQYRPVSAVLNVKYTGVADKVQGIRSGGFIAAYNSFKNAEGTAFGINSDSILSAFIHD